MTRYNVGAPPPTETNLPNLVAAGKSDLLTICHSIPLSREQKDTLASFITTLHTSTFRAPSFFVNVRFVTPEADGDYYVAGKARPTSPNRITATVRTSPTRTKEIFDSTAQKIAAKWNEVVNDSAIAAPLDGSLTQDQVSRLKALHLVVFQPMLAALEHGVVIPGAGEEQNWFRENMAYFKEQAEIHNNKEFQDMLHEVSQSQELQVLL
ncbi:hypothetical protein NQ176_g9285 [Zarea fungicola]|uniref:Uncharacterized protein n=1 Tax=Zarea fungicola TaxID=93591 RepID=A0ACC1MMK3_9HYPO|nr:hypothetical protein NQ176_g9285 [Lecanicillium fungicola]